jgi:hypothetical protein
MLILQARLPTVTELTASVAHHDILSQLFDIRETTIHNSSENMATVWWQRKVATSNSGHMAWLIRLQAVHQCHSRYVPTFDYIAGESNEMTEVCIRLWHLIDSQLLTFFNDSLPQRQPQQLSQLRKPMHSTLTWVLSTSGSKLELPHNVPRQWRTIGPVGMCHAWNRMLTHISELGRTPSHCSKSLWNDTKTGVWLPARKPCELALWRTRSAQWHRRTPNWGGSTDPRKYTHGGIYFCIQR